VLQYPGPDGVRPSALAERAGMTKQAMNQLLRSLESAGGVERAAAEADGRARGASHEARTRASARIIDILRDIEREWSAELGPKPFAQLKALLVRVWESPLTWPDRSTGDGD